MALPISHAVYMIEHRSEHHTRGIAPAGTLVVALATEDGLVVCADKRTYDYMRGDLDNAVKIRKLGPAALLSSTGSPTFYDIVTNRLSGQQSLRLAFDADAVAAEYFVTHEFNNSEPFWKGLAGRLVSAFQAYVGARPFAYWPETGNPPDNALFQLAIFFLDDSKHLQATFVRFGYIKVSPPSITVSAIHELPTTFERVKPMVLGNLAVWEELKLGDDKRFNDIRSEAQLMRFVRDKPAVNTVTTNAALTFAHRLITVTSQRTHLLENTTFHVGPTTDCALLSKRDGFQWLNAQGPSK
ncbi:MAG: hypothetical protein HY619_07905 [Thaumarchaeota archaeon]|nr:hypothetical protein [Nitrososphaerota archaeon]